MFGTIFSPTRFDSLFRTGFSLFWRKVFVQVYGTATAAFFTFLELLLLFDELLVPFFRNFYHFLSFPLADLARGLILPFLYVNIIRNKAYFFAGVSFIFMAISPSEFNLISLTSISSPFYRQFLICFPSCYDSIVLQTVYKVNGFFVLFSRKFKSFPQVLQG